MRFGILGPLEVVDDTGEPVDIGGAQPRALIGLLLLARRHVVAADALVEALWPDARPSSPLGTVQTYVSRLRRTLRPHELRWEPPGYRLLVDDEDVDAWRFERLAGDAHAALERGDAATARTLLLEADALWRGPALMELRDVDAGAAAVAERLEERRLVAREEQLAADLALGRHELAVGELTELVAAHPFREGLRAQLALALYRSGRQADALRAVADARRALRDELGLEPGPELKALEASILAHDPSLAPPNTPVRQARPRPVRAAAAPPDSSLVGREHEVDVLAAVLDGGVSGVRAVVVEGEAGIGKSCLLEELARLARERDALVLQGRAHETGAAPVLWPWRSALRGLAAAAPDAGSNPLETLLGAFTATAVDAAPLDELVLFEAVTAALVTASRERTVVVLFDDMHWADDASLRLVTHLAVELGPADVVFGLTFRPVATGPAGALAACLSSLARRPSTRRFVLRGLRETAIATLVQRITGEAIEPDALRLITERAEGNAFFAIELARLLHDGTPGAPDVAAEIPAGVRDVLRQRIGRLPTSTVALLEVAAVIGREFDVEVLAQAVDPSPADLDALEPALVEGLIHGGERPGSYRFVHALVHEATVEELPELRRARLHLRVADALESQAAVDGDVAAVVAEHLWSAVPLGVTTRAAAALERAAGHAIRRSSYADAAGLLQRAASLRRRASEPHSETDALAALFFVERVVHGHRAALNGPTVQRARSLAEATGRVDVLARLAWAEWVAADKARQAQRSAAMATELVALASGSEDPIVRGLSLHARGVGHWHAGELHAAARDLDGAVALAAAGATHAHSLIELLTAPLRPNSWPLGHPVVPFVHVLVGDLDAPAARFEQLATTQRHPYASTIVWTFAGFAALATGDLHAAVDYGRRGAESEPRPASSYWHLASELCLGAALAASGALDEGRALVDAALPRYLATDTRLFVSLVQARLAHALANAGRAAEAEAVLAESIALATECGDVWTEPLTTLIGALVAHTGGADGAEVAARLERAYARARAQGAGGVAEHVAATAATLGISLATE